LGGSLLRSSGLVEEGTGLRNRRAKLGHWGCGREKLRKVSSSRQILGTGEGRGLEFICGGGRRRKCRWRKEGS
jgi:hypothetical protein